MFEKQPALTSSRHERAAVLALVADLKRDRHRAATLIDAAGSAVGLLEGRWGALEPDELLMAEELRRQVTSAAISQQEAMITELERAHIQVITILDDAYPFNLRMVFNRPPVLFVRGRLPANRRAIAIVGTRQATPEGLRRAEQIAAELVALGYTVVSGLARGIDGAAHRQALAAGGQTLAVMGTGIRRVYPPEHQALADDIGRGGALVSQFWPDTPPTKGTFPLRNAVLSGISAGLVVVQGSAHSGSSMQARIAFEQGRPVFFVEGVSAEEEWARRYLDQGLGRVVRSAAEIAEATRFLTERPDRGTLT